MNVKRWICRMLGVILSFGHYAVHAQTGLELRAASVLVGHFETVFYAKADFLSSSEAYDGMDRRSAESLRLPFAVLLGGLKHSTTRDSGELLTKSVAVILGARGFRAPDGLGAVHSERCYIVIMGGNNKPDIGKYFNLTSSGYLDGVRVWKWSAQLGEFGEEAPKRPSIFYAAQVVGSYLVIANNRDDFQSVMRGLKVKGTSQSVLAAIPDWEILGRHEIWAHRNLRRDGIIDEEAAGLSFVTPDVKALSFFVDFEKQDSFIRILSSDGKEEPRLTRAGDPPSLNHLSEGIWEAMIPFSENHNEYSPLLLVLDRFGFGVYI